MIETFSLFTSIALSIFIEAMPFLVIGALLSSAIEVFVSTERLLSIVPKSLVGGLALGISAGFVLPTCECGVVPIVRRLINKGVPPYIALAYMLAAPIVNPVVLASTYIAFRGSFTMVFSRIALAVLVAAVVGIISKYIVKVVKDKANGSHEKIHTEDYHDHGNGHDHEHHHSHEHDTFMQKIKATLVHAAYEFMEMGKFLILGALIAAAFKTFLPENIMSFFSQNLTLSILGMMILAVLLSVCSEADAFVAASFVGFPMVSQLAFIAVGPMVDLKLIGMFSITFSRKMVFVLVLVPFILVFLASLLIANMGIL
jgi:uncharacterized membrane protein YraQ (UPF0718 family)